MKTKIIFVLIFFALIGTVNAATYYVSPSGNDSNPGTSEQPWKTLDRVYTTYIGSGPHVTGGDTVLLRNGNYGRFAVTIDSDRTGWVTYKNDTGHTPVLIGIDITGGTGSTFGGIDTYFWFEGLTINGIANINNCAMFRTANYNKLINCTITGGNYANNTYCVYLGPIGYNPHDLTVTGCTMSGFNTGVYIWGDNAIIEHNYIYDMSQLGFQGTLKNGSFSYNEIKNVVKTLAAADDPDGYLSYHCDGIYFGGGTNAVINGNKIHEGIMQGIAYYETFPAGSSNVTISNNLIYSINTTSAYLRAGGEYNVIDLALINNTVLGLATLETAHNSNPTVTKMYNNIFSSFGMDTDQNGHYARVIGHGNNIFGGDPNGTGGTYKFNTNSTELVNQNFSNGYFTNYSANDFSLSASSPAINFGNAAFAPANDILDNPRDSQPDAGAYEFQGTQQPCTTTQLMNYISQWKQGNITMLVLMQKISAWKAGTGC